MLHPFLGMDVPWLLRNQALRHGDHPFLIWEPFDGRTKVMGYAAFRQRCVDLAAAMARRGVRPGQHVLVHLDNCPEALLAWYACAELGAVAVTTNTRSALPELRYYVADSGAVAAVTQPRYAELVNEAAPELRWLAVTAHDAGEPLMPGQAPARGDSFDALLAEGADAAPPRRAPDPSPPVAIQYTSGTTARPKGVVWTHANALWGARVNAAHERLHPDDVHHVVLPLFHANAMAYSVLAALWAGATAVLQPRFSSSRFWGAALKHRTTFASLAPFCLKALLNVETPARHSLRLIGLGRSDPAAAARLGVGIVSWWGMTETISHAILGDPELTSAGAIGRPAPEYGVHVLRGDGSPVGPGETGDLLITGVPGVSLFLEYLNNPAATADSYDAAGRLRTGDRVTLLEDGCIRFADRAKDMLKVGGENVASSEIEAVIAAVPGVREVAVVAKRHPMLDEVPVAFVLFHRDPPGGVEEVEVMARIHAACATHLADFKRPVEVRVLEEFPRSVLEKVAKAELRRLVETGTRPRPSSP
ncbi:ATP-dependent acyl-CoA ligase [Siccirubricoccus deserti]|nr:AMP-binding protein [Siccirubricoccus deserti]GGC68535.1 ATP-dependent acyl-CoA ligase [Siccirubricoccus deserti]